MPQTDYKPTFGIPLLPVEVVSQGSTATDNQNKELGKSKYWLFAGVVVLALAGYYIFKNK